MTELKKISTFFLLVPLLLAVNHQPVIAQDDGASFRELFNRQFGYAARVLNLARIMPEETYDWRPDEGVRSVEEVFTHIAYYNYYYPENSLGIPVPDDVDLGNMESVTGKEEVVRILEESLHHLQQAVAEMPDSGFSEPAVFYGSQTDVKGVLTSLLLHKSEHIGQAVAYARMNGIAPPW